MSLNVPFALESSGQLWNLNIESDGNLSINSNAASGGVTRVVVDSVWGKFGIGTTESEAMLDVCSQIGSFGESVARFYNPKFDASVLVESGIGQEAYLRFKNLDTGDNAWMVGMDDDEVFKISYGKDLEIRDTDAKFAILQSGEVGIGTNNPTEKLQVMGNICASGSIGQCSDVKYKQHIEPLKNALNQVLALSAKRYQWQPATYPQTINNNQGQIGFIAQEVEAVCPEVVFTDNQGDKYLDYSRLTSVLVEAIKEQQQLIQQQQSALGDALTRIAQLEKSQL